MVLGRLGEPECTKGAGAGGGGSGVLVRVLGRACRRGGGVGVDTDGVDIPGPFLVGDGDGATGGDFLLTDVEGLLLRSTLKVSLLMRGIT